MNIRHLRPGEDWPDTLFMGFSGPQLDRDWTWVAEDAGVVKVGLLASPVHSVVFILRLVASTDAPRMAIRTLFNEALREVKERGYLGYMTLVDPLTPEGLKIERLAKHRGGLDWPAMLKLVCGSFRDMEKV